MKFNVKLNKDVRVIRSRRDLANALEELLQEKNYDDITIKEIADKAMVSKLTFYNNFLDKKDLLKFLYTRYLNEIYSLIPKVDENLTNEELYKKVLTIVIHYIYQSPLKFKKMIQNDSSRTMYWIFSSFIQENTIKYSKYFSGFIKENIPIEIIAYSFAGSCTSLLYNMFLNDDNKYKYSEDTMVNYIYELTVSPFKKKD